MRRICSTILTTYLLGTTATIAADLPVRKGPIVVPVPANPFTWSGGYLGIDGGGAFATPGKSCLNAIGFTPVLPSTFTFPAISCAQQGATYNLGGHAGWNFAPFSGTTAVDPLGQITTSGIVVGVDAGLDYIGHVKANQFTTTFFGNPLGPTVIDPASGYYRFNVQTHPTYLGTALARVGYAINNVLIYAGAGMAYGGNSNQGTIGYWAQPQYHLVGGALTSGPVGLPTFTYANSSHASSHIGLALGGGIKYALTNNFIVGMDYTYAALGTKNALFLAPSTAMIGGIPVGQTHIFSEKVKYNTSLAKVTAEYKF